MCISPSATISSVEDRVVDIVLKQFGPGLLKSDINRETRFIDDLGGDSLDVLELIDELEEEFDDNKDIKFDISDDEAAQIKTVGDAILCVSQKLGVRV